LGDIGLRLVDKRGMSGRRLRSTAEAWRIRQVLSLFDNKLKFPPSKKTRAFKQSITGNISLNRFMAVDRPFDKSNPFSNNVMILI
jgi:hypothetical protein